MKTQVIMRRELLGAEVCQRSDDGFFSATDLVKAGNKWRVANGLEFFNMNNWLANKGTKEFIAELESKYGKVRINSKGKGSHTWFHPLLFIDMALAISPKLKVETYEWLFDNLIKFRNESGDSYKRMCGALYAHARNQREFPKYVSNVAEMIKITCAVSDWQTATQEQLAKRDRIHSEIELLSDVMNDNTQAVRLALRRNGLNIEV